MSELKYTICYFDMLDVCIGFKQTDTFIQVLGGYSRIDIIAHGTYFIPESMNPLGKDAMALRYYAQSKVGS